MLNGAMRPALSSKGQTGCVPKGELAGIAVRETGVQGRLQGQDSGPESPPDGTSRTGPGCTCSRLPDSLSRWSLGDSGSVLRKPGPPPDPRALQISSAPELWGRTGQDCGPAAPPCPN